MSHAFRLPDIGEGLTDAEIVEWHVSVGDVVGVDQLIVEVETAKTTVEITATDAGTVLTLGGQTGDIINVGEVLFVIGEAGSLVADLPENALGGVASVDDGGEETKTPAKQEIAVGRPPNNLGKATGIASRPRAMPIVRKLAKDRGVDLAKVQGSGPGGAITRADIKNASAGAEIGDDVPLSRTRRAIAHHMTESWTTIPHVTVQAEVRAEQLMEARRQRSPKPLPIEALVGAAVLPLLAQYREFNAVLRGDAVAYREECNLGFAVDAEAGLLIAVIRDAGSLSVDDLAQEFERVSEGALAGNLTPEEATGQTFTISNIGALGGGHGTPIIPMGTSAILSIGRAVKQPVVENGELSIGLVAPIDLSYDHRLIDGGLGQRFLADLVTNLENAIR